MVQLADAIVLRSGIGFEPHQYGPSPEELAQALDIDPGQLQQVYHRLAGSVKDRTDILGIDMPNAASKYCDAAAAAVAQLSAANTKLSHDSAHTQSTVGMGDLLSGFLLSVKPSDCPLDIAEQLIVRWQKFYETGAVCLYLAADEQAGPVEVALVEALGASRVVLLEGPEHEQLPNGGGPGHVAIANAHGRVDWLLEQLDVEFNRYGTRMLPLTAGGRTIGAIIFEMHHSEDVEFFGNGYRAFADVAAAVLEMAMSQRRDRRLAEQFIPSAPRVSQLRATTADDLLDAMAELAAGAAHELNNPLAVISGRAQLLTDGETDPDKRQALEQISVNTREVAAIIEGLMAFAEPPQPRSEPIDVGQLIDESIQLAGRQTGAADVEIRTNIAEGVAEAFVDSAQIASAIANIISNAVESYEGNPGVITVAADYLEATNMVKVSVRDSGCGMDSDTAQKAAVPFFSLKNAGRKRGMGLAFAQRFVTINGGRMIIASRPGSGTTVAVELPAG